jgi:glycosyltransferase involved in cell wall biosynthesis
MKIAIVTNMPAPYRIPIFEKIAQIYQDDFLVLYSTRAEPNRSWNLGELPFKHIFLKENIIAKTEGLSFVHNNPDTWKHLKKFNPDIVITTGFYPTSLYAWVYSLIYRKKHIPMTDGWIGVEKHLSWIHKIVRILVFNTSHAFLGASKNSLDLYRSYGMKNHQLFQSHLCVENSIFCNEKSFKDRKYDLMFSGQFIERKLPLFFAEVAKKVSEQIPNLKVLILGNGPLKDNFFTLLKQYKIDFHYAGFVSQEELPNYYADAKLFLFPTLLDAWGVVVNEAMASGTPVITTPFAGVINDLITHEETGYILPIDSDMWATQIVQLLNSPNQWNNLSSNAKEHVQHYNFDIATKGMLDAIHYVDSH